MQMACTKSATLWLTESGSTFYEGVAATIGGSSTVEAAPFPPTEGTVVKAIAAHNSAAHVLFVGDDGALYAVGEGEAGQLGDGKEKNSLTATFVNFSGKKVRGCWCWSCWSCWSC